MKKIKIDIPDKGYNVYLGRDIFASLPSLLRKEKISGNIFITIDNNVKKLYPTLLDMYFQNPAIDKERITIFSSEKNKSFETVQKIHSSLIKNNMGRDSLIIAIGGGIVGDISGFASATYMRGVNYLQVPTTLLAAVDSSVGGKTGINFGSRKNIIGSFHQPSMVLIDTSFFSTLPEEEMLCGVGEIIKYCFLTDNRYYNYVSRNIDKILQNDTKVIEKIISDSVKYKSDVVAADEKESGIRKVLNLGHTFAHAFEIQQNHKLKHGQAVIAGITASLYLSQKLGLIDKKSLRDYLELINFFRGKIRLSNVDVNLIWKIMQSDKKNRENQVRFVLLKEIGEIITDIPAEKRLVKKSILESISHFQ